jgi:hypothetical protein
MMRSWVGGRRLRQLAGFLHRGKDKPTSATLTRPLALPLSNLRPSHSSRAGRRRVSAGSENAHDEVLGWGSAPSSVGGLSASRQRQTWLTLWTSATLTRPLALPLSNLRPSHSSRAGRRRVSAGRCASRTLMMRSWVGGRRLRQLAGFLHRGKDKRGSGPPRHTKRADVSRDAGAMDQYGQESPLGRG